MWCDHLGETLGLIFLYLHRCRSAVTPLKAMESIGVKEKKDQVHQRVDMAAPRIKRSGWGFP